MYLYGFQAVIRIVSIIYFNFCNDVIYENQGTPDIWNGKKGTITVSVSKDGVDIDPDKQAFYNVTIKIEKLYLYDSDSENQIIIDKGIFWDVAVGWFPG